MKSRSSQYKPLLLTTTLRNPQRIKDFLSVIYVYNKKILTNRIIDEVVFQLIKKRIYTPIFISKNQSLVVKHKNEIDFSDEEVKLIIDNSIQNHKEAGFDKGWPSRFDTWYKFLKELGLIFYEMNQPIIFSSAAEMLLSSEEENKSLLEQQVFLNCFAKYQRNNPYRKVLNNNNPLALLLKTTLYLKERMKDKFSGLSIKEIPLLLCWRDNNHIKLAEQIIKIRELFGLTPSNEVIYDYCKDLLEINEEDEIRFKISNITREMPDDFVRKVRLTGLITIKGFGRFIDLNYKEIIKINHIIKEYYETRSFDSNLAYHNFMSFIDRNLITETVSRNEETLDYKLFEKWTNLFDLETILFELDILSSNKKFSKNEVLKYMDEPIRLEFLTALSIKKAFPEYEVYPNYITDDEGLPIRFAGGGKPDILCVDGSGTLLIEVTMLTGTQQNIREIPSIHRHLLESLTKDEKSISIMIAPQLHKDTLEYSSFLNFKYNINIKTMKISDFINHLNLRKEIRV
jgi:hypothetical protein